MPVRSLSLSILKWPDRDAVVAALRRWVERVCRERGDVVAVGYFGSYARGDWGVGSDLDLVIIIEDSDEPFERRSAGWDTASIPVPVDALVYTRAEWDAMDRSSRFRAMLDREAQWLARRAEAERGAG